MPHAVSSATAGDTPASPPTASARRLNVLAAAAGAQSYLEIGVQTGATFFAVDVPHKVAVDPVFKFDHLEHADAATEFHPVPSDAYFAGLPLQQKFDLIFLDGLHTFEQTFRDFCNSLAHCHDRTLWVIDDTVPSDIYSAHKVQSQAVARRLAETAADKRKRAWQGDVYKTVFAIRDFFPSFSYCTITGGHKQTLLWLEARSEAPLHDNLETISRMDYFEFLRQVDVMRLMPESEALQQVTGRFGV